MLTASNRLGRLGRLSKGRSKGESITLGFVAWLTRAVAPDLLDVSLGVALDVLEWHRSSEGVSNGLDRTLRVCDLHIFWAGALGWHSLNRCGGQDGGEKDRCDLHFDSIYVEVSL